MTDVYVYRLRKNYESLLRDLEPRQVLNYLYQEDVIDGVDRDEIRAEKTRTKQAEVLLDCLERRGANAIQYFIKGLQKSSQKYLAEILSKPLANESTGHSNDGTNASCEFYPMKRNPVGLALIINNAEFDKNGPVKLTCREGSDKDVMKMTLLFQKLNFNVKVRKNHTAAEMENLVRELALDDHTNYDCCVLFLMSHGLETGIYGSDGRVMTTKYIIEKFSAKFSPSLANKPKLIFIQACRGCEADKGIVVTDSPDDTSPYSSQESNASKNHPAALNLLGSPIVPEFPKIPSDADIFIAFASSSNHAALRNTLHGGWYVDELYKVMIKDASRDDLVSMMTKVTDNVSKKISGNNMQCPQQLTNLRKKLRFCPKMKRDL